LTSDRRVLFTIECLHPHICGPKQDDDSIIAHINYGVEGSDVSPVAFVFDVCRVKEEPAIAYVQVSIIYLFAAISH
jgi:hypothetical protein